ncbi:glycoside hydrolase family 26 protein [Rhodococcus sp. Rp3]|uniref:glycoside hydrolase family 26 protein n=1 Tax=Rhodococcus sp. Rp3 TaxID=2807635 RepID=UPI00233EE189|nr:glycosyl hydrolase [Rhodococcus sp. Rp3]MDC3726294.1 endoglucanase [Rhodococcus sp. Rp3]
MVAALLALSLCAACDSRRQCEPISAPLDETSTACPRFGISTPGGPVAVDEYRAVTEAVGAAPGAVLWFVDFLSPPPVGALDIVRASGADPIVTWEPWLQRGDGTYDRTSITMADIAAGVHDDHLYRWADELTAWGGTVYLRFAHEPNGDWYPWGPAGGTPPETYVAAWRHVHELFASEGAENVRWIWTVNVPHEGSSPIAPLYPGDDHVDVVGVDGYNWGTTRPWSRWQSPEELFGPTFDELGRIAPGRPVAVTEVASAEAGGSKPDWIRDLVGYLDSHPAATTFVWFHHNKETDWRLTSTAECAAALGDALHRRHTAR